jgi:hypothetical protein
MRACRSTGTSQSLLHAPWLITSVVQRVRRETDRPWRAKLRSSFPGSSALQRFHSSKISEEFMPCVRACTGSVFRVSLIIAGNQVMHEIIFGAGVFSSWIITAVKMGSGVGVVRGLLSRFWWYANVSQSDVFARGNLRWALYFVR